LKVKKPHRVQFILIFLDHLIFRLIFVDVLILSFVGMLKNLLLVLIFL